MTTRAAPIAAAPQQRLTPGRACLGLALATLALAAWTAESRLGLGHAWQGLLAPHEGAEAQWVAHVSWWPRLAVALLGGAGLALAGVLMQQVLRNPLAAPTTLGVASGANLALLAATLVAPGLLAAGREWVALAGGALAMGLVFALAWRRRLAPMVVVLAGLVVNLYCGALGTVLLLFHQEALKGLMIWGAGSLTQSGWGGVTYLLPRLVLAAVLAALLIRPLRLLELDDTNARSLGGSLRRLRLAGLGLAVFVTACVISVIGVVGFIGLAAPAIVRLLGARRLAARLGWSTLLGALLLAATDLLLQHTDGLVPTLIPTGAATAALGAPLLLWLLPRLRLGGSPNTASGAALARRHPAPRRRIAGLAVALLMAIGAALLIGQGTHGWTLIGAGGDPATLPWRLPRVIAAAGAGLLLALAGTLIQRVTGNPMASPEVLGISGGTAMGLMAALYWLPRAGTPELLSFGTLAALATLALLVALNRRQQFRAAPLLLSGVAITALFDAVRSLVLAGGDPRAQQVLAWLSGSTYYLDLPTALVVLGLATALLLAVLPLSRRLELLTLGAPAARSLGVAVVRVRLRVLVLVALVTAGATLVVGPLSFVGLLAPHLARLLGLARVRAQLVGAGLAGAALMVLADWLGRQWLFPQEIPAGLMASLLGGAYFLWALRRL